MHFVFVQENCGHQNTAHQDRPSATPKIVTAEWYATAGETIYDNPPPPIRYQAVRSTCDIDTIELVGCAENGLQGCQMFVALRPEVVLLDLRLPGLSGFDLIRMFKRQRPECVLIVLTTFADDAIRARCVNLGADYFFDKATELDQVVELLNPKKANLITLTQNQLLKRPQLSPVQ